MVMSSAFVLALICAGLMGYAIQSGATCMVYAVSEMVEKRRFTRLVAMLEAGLWVACMMAVASGLNLAPDQPAPYPPSWSTVLGGILLGLGAYLNGACVFGSVARFGSGELGFALTPIGYLLGIRIFDSLWGREPSVAEGPGSALALPGILALGFAAYAAFRSIRTIYWTVWRSRSDQSPHLWQPHEATLVIGVTFAIMLLTVGRWTYPELLADLSRGKMGETASRLLLFAALLFGARWGGLRHGRRAWQAPDGARVRACLAGGAMMGAGGALIPGGNDGLVLVGLRFLMPYALLALGTMVATVGLAIGAQRLRAPSA
ncbi:YeeE/YedE thiosulfate transporter family protein [Novosphingobium sp.]|uniref:YeeE/YedE thiosulfate transporter family protein n=1 Tax=Novosphingobium sp. TaxID=1874826 RepID=UPI0026134036|nr:YeeE/YedE thiosulfate transporter family protein [Novosphingobium sp.]